MATNKNETQYATCNTPKKFWAVWKEEDEDWLQEPIKLNGYDYDFNEIVIFDEKGKCHKVVNLKAFVSKYKVLAISDDKDLLRGIKGESGHLINLNEYRRSRDGYIPL